LFQCCRLATVTPAKAGVQLVITWIPACAGNDHFTMSSRPACLAAAWRNWYQAAPSRLSRAKHSPYRFLHRAVSKHLAHGYSGPKRSMHDALCYGTPPPPPLAWESPGSALHRLASVILRGYLGLCPHETTNHWAVPVACLNSRCRHRWRLRKPSSRREVRRKEYEVWRRSKLGTATNRESYLLSSRLKNPSSSMLFKSDRSKNSAAFLPRRCGSE